MAAVTSDHMCDSHQKDQKKYVPYYDGWSRLCPSCITQEEQRELKIVADCEAEKRKKALDDRAAYDAAKEAETLFWKRKHELEDAERSERNALYDAFICTCGQPRHNCSKCKL